jgi:hypothetical protein
LVQGDAVVAILVQALKDLQQLLIAEVFHGRGERGRESAHERERGEGERK